MATGINALEPMRKCCVPYYVLVVLVLAHALRLYSYHLGAWYVPPLQYTYYELGFYNVTVGSCDGTSTGTCTVLCTTIVMTDGGNV